LRLLSIRKLEIVLRQNLPNFFQFVAFVLDLRRCGLAGPFCLRCSYLDPFAFDAQCYLLFDSLTRSSDLFLLPA
jgi:hypothetical protein